MPLESRKSRGSHSIKLNPEGLKNIRETLMNCFIFDNLDKYCPRPILGLWTTKTTNLRKRSWKRRTSTARSVTPSMLRRKDAGVPSLEENARLGWMGLGLSLSRDSSRIFSRGLMPIAEPFLQVALKRILVATDFSEWSNRALLAGLAIAQRYVGAGTRSPIDVSPCGSAR